MQYELHWPLEYDEPAVIAQATLLAIVPYVAIPFRNTATTRSPSTRLVFEAQQQKQRSLSADAQGDGCRGVE